MLRLLVKAVSLPRASAVVWLERLISAFHFKVYHHMAIEFTEFSGGWSVLVEEAAFGLSYGVWIGFLFRLSILILQN